MDSDITRKKKCRYCGEEIPENAGRCPFCGSLLDVYVDSGEVTVKSWEQADNTIGAQDSREQDFGTQNPWDGNPQEKAPQENSRVQDPQDQDLQAQDTQEQDFQQQNPQQQNPQQNPQMSNLQPLNIQGQEYRPQGFRVQNRDTFPKPAYNVQPGRAGKSPLSNGMKVFLTVLFTIIPGLGQIAGIITAIVFMNEDDDADRKSSVSHCWLLRLSCLW